MAELSFCAIPWIRTLKARSLAEAMVNELKPCVQPHPHQPGLEGTVLLKCSPAWRLHIPPYSLTPRVQEVPCVTCLKYILLTHRSNLKGLIITEKSASELFPLLLLCFLSYYQQNQFQTTSNLWNSAHFIFKPAHRATYPGKKKWLRAYWMKESAQSPLSFEQK